MNFASPLFLFAFLPLSLAGYFLVGRKLRAAWLLIFSLLFCLWSGPLLFPVALAALLFNYWTGKKIAAEAEKSAARRRILAIAVGLNILALAFFKALVVYGPPALAGLQTMAGWPAEPLWVGYIRKVISLPTGISFYTFASIAYLVDVSASRIAPAENLFNFSQFFFFFPKFTAGPIARFQELAAQIRRPTLTGENVDAGLRRFAIGLAKKALIADRLGQVVDRGIFDQSLPNLNVGSAWMLLLFYTLQIYYDFSGYSDMAIGLARVLGFRLPENFDFPYISRSISEFWRRWHMTLSGWFRVYVFYPLERRRAGGRGLPQGANILIVFLLTGLWHGVTINFIIWGLLHGLAIAFETSTAGKRIKDLWPPLQNVYALLVVLAAWVFFRSNTPVFALAFLGNLVGINTGSGLQPYSLLPIINPSTWLAFAAGILFAGPLVPSLWKRLSSKAAMDNHANPAVIPAWMPDTLLAGLFLVSVIVITGSAYQPYIYGNF